MRSRCHGTITSSDANLSMYPIIVCARRPAGLEYDEKCLHCATASFTLRCHHWQCLNMTYGKLVNKERARERELNVGGKTEILNSSSSCAQRENLYFIKIKFPSSVHLPFLCVYFSLQIDAKRGNGIQKAASWLCNKSNSRWTGARAVEQQVR